MDKNQTRMIDAWFAENEDGEFVSHMAAVPYSVIGPTTDGGRLIFTTKPHVVAAIVEEEASGELGMIGRYGLPSHADLNWISELVGSRELLFLGDMDPVDLMVFAWLRAGLYPKSVAHFGVNDSLLGAFEITSTETLSIPFAPSEQRSVALLKEVFPDFGKTVGRSCTHMLERRQKIELEAVAKDRTKVIAALQSLE